MKKALVLAIVCAFGLGAAGFAQGALSGSWETSICIDPGPPVLFSGFDSVLTVDYTVSGWTFESVSTFSILGWVGQVFNVDGVLGAFTIGSNIVFNPAAATFTYWYNDATVNIAGVALDFQTILTTTGFGLAIGVSGGAQDLTFAADLYINSVAQAGPPPIWPVAAYCFCFNSIDFELTFPFCCIELVEVSLGFSQAGFDGITFAVTNITFPNLPWMVWDLELTFDDGAIGKVLTITPGLDLGDFACFTVYADLCVLQDPVCYTGVNIYGIELQCDFNGCTFTSISTLDPAYNEDLIGYADYWEKFCIECGGDSCCGGAFSFEVCIYFDSESELLFDFGEADIDLSFGISSNFDLTSDLVVGATGLVSWCIGFNVTF